MRIVLVDDSPDIQGALTRLLATRPGLEVVGCAEDGAEALRVIEARQPDLVVLDVELRGTDRGFDVLRTLRERWPAVDVVVLSNFGWSAMRHAFLSAGALAYFDKALEFEHALQWIAERAQASGGSVAPH